jgi:hypothetical protein
MNISAHRKKNKKCLDKYIFKHTTKMTSYMFKDYGFAVLSINSILFIPINCDDTWKNIKKSIISKNIESIEDCDICNDKREFDRFTYCINCNKEVCLTCALLIIKKNDYTFLCPFCRYNCCNLGMLLMEIIQIII